MPNTSYVKFYFFVEGVPKLKINLISVFKKKYLIITKKSILYFYKINVKFDNAAD